MARVEFFTCNDEVWLRSCQGVSLLDENNEEVISDLLERIRTFYPEAYSALTSCYSSSCLNLRYYNYLCVRRFCKCNFGTLDMTKEDIDAENRFNFEKVHCPLRGECKYEGIICNPKFNTKLSDAEQRVMLHVYNGKSNDEIADELYLSLNTVKNHIKSAYQKLKVRNRAEFIRYAENNNLFH